jgi:homoserine kinase
VSEPRLRATVRVPATTANLGPGFDILAMALQLQMTVTGEQLPDGRIEVLSPRPGELQDPSNHLVARSWMAACDVLDVPMERRGVRIDVSSEIPESRGLGSSAACIVGGVMLANALAGGGRWDEHDALVQAAAIEGHPDNVGAAILGGLVICASSTEVHRVDVPDRLRGVLFIPDAPLSTTAARAVLPREYSRADAVFNAARCALLVRAMLSGDLDSLGVAMEDRWHQPQRTALMPWLPGMIQAAREGGAHGAALSGAGPSVLALAPDAATPAVGAAMELAADRLEVPGRVRTLAVRNFGTRVDVGMARS